MLTRGQVYHQYGFAGYYAEPYHVLMFSDMYPPGTGDAGRLDMAKYYQVPLAAHVQVTGTASLKPYVGQDPTDPGTWTRPMNHTTGMFGRLHDDSARAARERKGAKRRG